MLYQHKVNFEIDIDFDDSITNQFQNNKTYISILFKEYILQNKRNIKFLKNYPEINKIIIYENNIKIFELHNANKNNYIDNIKITDIPCSP